MLCQAASPAICFIEYAIRYLYRRCGCLSLATTRNFTAELHHIDKISTQTWARRDHSVVGGGNLAILSHLVTPLAAAAAAVAG